MNTDNLVCDKIIVNGTEWANLCAHTVFEIYGQLDSGQPENLPKIHNWLAIVIHRPESSTHGHPRSRILDGEQLQDLLITETGFWSGPVTYGFVESGHGTNWMTIRQPDFARDVRL